MGFHIAAIPAPALNAAGGIVEVQATDGAAPGAATPGDIDGRVERFRQIFDQAVEAEQAAGGPAAAERQRTIDALGLDRTVVGEGVRTGDSILGGLSRLRGVFDAQEARIGEVVAGRGVSPTAAATEVLFAAQFEMVQYTMLVDVTSKLTGKATQSFDTLMKGQ